MSIQLQSNTDLTGSLNITGSLTLNGTPVGTTNTGSLLATASVSLNTITFTKGDGSTFPITVNTGSGGGGGGAAYGFQGLTSGSINYTFLFSDTGSGAIPMTFNPNSGGKQVWEMVENSGSIFASYDLTYTNANNAPSYLGNKGDIIFGGARHTYDGGNNAAGTITMIGGLQNKMRGGNGHYGSSMIGGAYNFINWNYQGNGDRYVLTVLGGESNEVGGSNYGVIAGGQGNTIKQQGFANSIFGGQNNTIDVNNSWGAIVGGKGNLLDYDGISTGVGTLYSGIFVGQNNKILPNISYSAIIGGYNITASAQNTVYVPNLNVSGSAIFSGSALSEVSALSISSQTASLDCSTGNSFTLTLVSGSATFLNPTNIQPGQTINVRITQPATAFGTMTFPSSIKQPSANTYTPTLASDAVDIITLISFDSSSLYLSSIKNLV